MQENQKLMPGKLGKDCPYGGHGDNECCCDECDYLQCCIKQDYEGQCEGCVIDCPRNDNKLCR